MSTTEDQQTTTVADHFRFGDFSVMQAIQAGLKHIEPFAIAQDPPSPKEALRRIAKGIQDFLYRAKQDRKTCLEDRPYVGNDKYRASNIPGVVTAGIAYMFFHYGFEKDEKNALIAEYVGNLEGLMNGLWDQAVFGDAIVIPVDEAVMASTEDAGSALK